MLKDNKKLWFVGACVFVFGLGLGLGFGGGKYFRHPIKADSNGTVKVAYPYQGDASDPKVYHHAQLNMLVGNGQAGSSDRIEVVTKNGQHIILGNNAQIEHGQDVHLSYK